MNLSQIHKMQLKNAVERVLHVNGNYTGGILEMTIVIDHSYTKEDIMPYVKDVVTALKGFGEVFRNVRMNVVSYKTEDQIENQVIPSTFLQMGKSFEAYECIDNKKSLDALVANLKFYHARSKLILAILTEPEYVKDKKNVINAMQPFLYRKIIFLNIDKITMGNVLFHELLQ